MPRPKLLRFPNNSKLRYFDMSSNQIEHLREDYFSSLTQLKYLNMSHNKIKYLTNKHFYFQTALTDLDLRNNRITRIADKLFYNLKVVDNIYISMANLSKEDKINIKSSINSDFKKYGRKVFGTEYYTATNLIVDDVGNDCELVLFYLTNFILLNFKTENDISVFWRTCSSFSFFEPKKYFNVSV